MVKKPVKQKGQPVVEAPAAPAKPVAKSLNFTPFDRRLFPALDALGEQRGTIFFQRSRTWIMNYLLEEGLAKYGTWPPADAG